MFTRKDAVRNPLTLPAYSGPYHVLAHTDKHFTTNLNGIQETVPVDKLKGTCKSLMGCEVMRMALLCVTHCTYNKNKRIIQLCVREKRETQPCRMFKKRFIDMLTCLSVCASCIQDNKYRTIVLTTSLASQTFPSSANTRQNLQWSLFQLWKDGTHWNRM